MTFIKFQNLFINLENVEYVSAISLETGTHASCSIGFVSGVERVFKSKTSQDADKALFTNEYEGLVAATGIVTFGR